MELSNSITLLIAIGTQLMSALGLFWSITNSFNTKLDAFRQEVTKDIQDVTREINELKIEQAKQGGELHRLNDKVEYIYKFLPTPKLAIQQDKEV
jgi:archaellum component FlaC